MGRSIQWRTPREGTGRSFGTTVQFGRRNDAGTGYMSYSDRVGPSVIVLHEFFGLQDSFKTYADKLNDEGFTALVLDLYDGVVVDSVEDAKRLADGLDDDRAMRKLNAAADHLTANWHPRLGVVGFSLGGYLAVRFAHDRQVDAIVLYYGLNRFDLDRWRTPILGHFADKDEWESVDEARSTFTALADADVDAEMHVYPDTTHWFANSAVEDAFNPDAAGKAMERTIAFLRRELA
jgi:carboxymethylenebutenolidase